MTTTTLMLRSAPMERVSKHGHEHRVFSPPFETARSARLLRVRWIVESGTKKLDAPFDASGHQSR